MINNNQAKSQIFIHIGYPKSASTTLQKSLFKRHSQINDLSKNSWQNKNKDFELFYYNLAFLNTIAYKSSRNLDLYEQKIKAYLNSQKAQMFSFEVFSTSWHRDVYIKAKRLKELFPNAKIIVIVRNQYSFLTSLYNYYIRRSLFKNAPYLPFHPGYTGKRLLSFEDWLDANFKYREKGVIDDLKYYETIKLYQGIFGKNNIKIFLFEELVENLDCFVNKISDFLGINSEEAKKCLEGEKKNSQYSQRFLRVLKIKNKFLPFFKTPSFMKKPIKKFLHKGGVKKIKFPFNWRGEIRDFYKTSNKKLKQEFGLDIDKYNYPF